MSMPFKSLLVAGALALIPYHGGASGFANLPVAVATAQKASMHAAVDATAATEASRDVNPWALAGLLLAVMALGAARRRHG